MRIYIKNMVCRRCILAVQNVAGQLGIDFSNIQMGFLETREELSVEVYTKLDTALKNIGFEIIGDKKSRLIEKVKAIVIDKVHHSDQEAMVSNWSDVIAGSIHYEYNYISNLFSSVEGITIEQFIIRQKMEKVKELLVYDEFNLSEIAHHMGYSSASYLTNQFKKNTGMTPGQFRKLVSKDRKAIDKL